MAVPWDNKLACCPLGLHKNSIVIQKREFLLCLMAVSYDDLGPKSKKTKKRIRKTLNVCHVEQSSSASFHSE